MTSMTTRAAILLTLLLLFPRPQLAQEPAAVRIEKAVPYLPADRAELAVLYLPPQFEPGTQYPGVLIIHGGGWTGGKRDAAREINIGTTLASFRHAPAACRHWLDAGFGRASGFRRAGSRIGTRSIRP